MNTMPCGNDGNNGNELESPDYLRGVKSSTCLLLTPSPTTLDFKHPLAEEMADAAFLSLNDDNKSINIGNSEANGGDTSSSGDSNSVVQDPVSAQLINNISMLDYQTLSKNGDIIIGQPECKLNGSLSVSNRKLPDFVNWNWPLIRNILLWIVLSGLIACLAAIVTMIVTIPKTCNPDLPWHQGKIFYEIFPASFKDSNNDGYGDLKGLIKKVDYIKELGGSAVHLNYIFEAYDYPVHFYNTSNVLQIDRSIGVLKDFQELIAALHERDMHIILDIPVTSLLTPDPFPISNKTSLAYNESDLSDVDPTTISILYWTCEQNVDGIYLKNLENFVDDVNFGKSLQLWKGLLGHGKILMASEATLEKAKGESLTILLNRIDLIDIHVDLTKGVKCLKDKISSVTSGILWERPHYPWVHWNVGSIDSERISSKTFNNTLALIALELLLPGSVGIFYGDEIALGSLEQHEVESDFPEPVYIHNLATMSFSDSEKKDNAILPWNHELAKQPRFENLKVIQDLITMRLDTPTIYLRGIYKEGNVLKNIDIRKTEDNLVVIERWFPRRNTCVFVGNFGSEAITTDLTSMFYGGLVVGSTNASLVGQVLYFDKVTFLPNSAIVLKLEK